MGFILNQQACFNLVRQTDLCRDRQSIVYAGNGEFHVLDELRGDR